MLDKHVKVLVPDVDVLTSAKKLVIEVSVDFVAGNIGSGEAARDTLAVVKGVSRLRVSVGGGFICTIPEVRGHMRQRSGLSPR